MTDAERAALRREALLAAALELLARGEQPTVSNVAKRASVGRHAFYEAFENVPHALHVVTQEAERRLLARVPTARHLTDTPVAALHRYTAAWLTAVVENRDCYRVATRDASPNTGLQRRLTLDLRALAERGTRAGTYSRDASGLRVPTAVGALRAATAWFADSADHHRHLASTGHELATCLERILR